MKDFLYAPVVAELADTCANMYRLGWDERNGGNISVLLNENEITEYIDPRNVLRSIPIGFSCREMAGKYLLLTGTGKFFKNVSKDPAANLGLIRIDESGKTAEVLWGFSDGGKFTSELPTHLMTHAARLQADPEHRVVTHCHPTHLLAMTYVHELDARSITRDLWRMSIESIMTFPDGLGVMPWRLCGTVEIGAETAHLMRSYRLVIWGMHGIYGAGKTLDEAFGLIETVEKAAQIYMLTAHLPRVNTITDEQLRRTAEYLGLPYRMDWLE